MILYKTMEKIVYDLTSQSGLVDTKGKLQQIQPIAIARQATPEALSIKTSGAVPGATATVNIDIDIEGPIEKLIDFFKNFVDRFFDVFDDTKKLEKQMELAIKTIEISRAAGAKSIDITINSKNETGLKLHLKEIDATIGGHFKKDNSITYSIIF